MRILFFIICFISFVIPASAEMQLMENKNLTFNIIPYFRADVVKLKNNVTLDSANKDDSPTYLGIDYSLGFDLQFKDGGPQAYLKMERNGPYLYDAPIWVYNTLMTSTAKVDTYRNEELLPRAAEFWYDFGLYKLPVRLKSGLFVYDAGNNISTPSDYNNYSLIFYNESENLKWQFYYCRPDLANKSYRGPRIKQEREQGIHYTPNKANYFATDVAFDLGKNSFQPYVEILLDRSGNRTNLFTTPTHKDLLGTFGIAWNLVLDKLSVGVEAARNFGKAKSSDDNFKDVEHCGYMFHTDASYDFNRLIPHYGFTFASGNKVTTDMVQNDETEITSGKNRAFSVYSPFNTNLSDSIYPDVEKLPFVAMGNGNGLNYGINRPTTFGDPMLLENLMLFNLGTDYKMTDKLTFTLDWWYLRSVERGVGKFEDTAKKLSPCLGHELDLSFNYEINKNVSLSLLSGYFFPGKYYREERDDTEGSLFTPFVRGDGNANGAYQIELSLTISL